MIVRRHGRQSGMARVMKHAPSVESETFTIRGDPVNQEAAAFKGRRPIGFMDFNPMEEAIGTVYVSQQFRRKGLANRMYKAAGRPAHSRELTTEGQAWAQQAGGIMPPAHEIERHGGLIPISHEQRIMPAAAKYIDEAATRTQTFTRIRRR